MDVINNYTSVVTHDGNTTAMNLLDEIFEPSDAYWRGIGIIPQSGLRIKDRFSDFDAQKRFNIEAREIPEPKGCLCGMILLGRSNPGECSHFGKSCTPSQPVGPCMVSSEGTCAAWYKYGTGA